MSPRRSAFIDIGTNTILCLIAEIRDTGRFRVLDDLAEIAGLGKGVDQTGLISAEGEQRALAVLERYLRSLQKSRRGRGERRRHQRSARRAE